MRFAFALILASAALAQSDLQFAELKNFQFESGETLATCRVGYRVFGQLNAQKSNAVLFPTWFSGKSSYLAGLIGPGKLADTSKLYVILVDALGNGVSSSPSNTPAPFPKISIRDMVESEHRLVTEVLGLNHLHAVIGISMGGMQTFQWMTSHPDFLDRAVAIVGSPRLSTPDLLLWQAQLSAIENAQASGGDLRAAMKAVQAIHQFALYTPSYWTTTAKASEFEKMKADFEKNARMGMDPLDWAAQVRAMMGHDVSKSFGGSLANAAGAVRAKVLVVTATEDHMVNPVTAREMADFGGFAKLNLETNCGHLATACEQGRIFEAVGRFLD